MYAGFYMETTVGQSGCSGGIHATKKRPLFMGRFLVEVGIASVQGITCFGSFRLQFYIVTRLLGVEIVKLLSIGGGCDIDFIDSNRCFLAEIKLRKGVEQFLGHAVKAFGNL